MTRFSFSSLRVRLLLLVLLAIIPALGLILYTAAMQRSSAAVEAKENALRLARLTASDQEQLVEGAHQLLISLAQLPQVRQRDSDACNTLFADLLKQYPQYAVLGAVDAKGNPFCSAIPIRKPFNSADRAWFQRAFLYRGFAVGDYAIGRASGKASLNLGYPVIDDRGDVQAVVLAALDLAWLNRLAAKARLPEGSVLSMTDHNGVILARHPHPEKWVGKSMREAPIFRAITARREEGTTSAAGVDGVERLYAFTPLHRTAQAGEVYLSVGIPQKVAFADAAAILKRNLVGLGVVAVLALVAAWFGADLFILRRVNTLVGATRQLAAGDLSARTGPAYGGGELGQLARVFDQMADSLEQREVERKRAEQRLASLHEINVATTSSLDLRAVLDVLLEKLDFFLPYAVVTTVRLLNRDTGELESLASRGLNEEEWRAQENRSLSGRAKKIVETKAPLTVRNVQTDQRSYNPEIYRKYGLISYLGVPLIAKGEAIGVLGLYTKEEHEFTKEEIEFLSTLARQAAIAIHNSQLYEETQTREAQLQETTRMLSALYSVATAASQSLDLDQVLQAAIEKIRGIFGFDATRIHIYDERTDELLLKTALESDPDRFTPARSFKKGKGIVGKVAESGKALIFEDIQTDTLYQQVAQLKFLPAFGYHFLAVFPIKGRLKNLGTLTCVGAPPRKLSSSELQLLEALLDQIAVAIENSGLYEEVRKRVQELQQKTTEVERANDDLKRREEIQKLLKELSQDITTLGLDSLLKKLTGKIREVFKVDVCDVRVAEQGAWRVTGVSGVEAERVQLDSSGTARGRSKWIIENRKPLLIPDITQPTELLGGESIRRIGIRGYVGVPLFFKDGQVVGILRALSYQPREFTQEEVDLLQQLANGAAIALENARLLEQTKRQAVELEKANRMQADFTAMIAHDLRSPLTAVNSAAAMLEDGLMGPVSEEQQQWLAKIQTHSRNLVELVNDFLDLSRLEAGQIDLAKEEVDLKRLIDNSIDSYLPLARGKRISLTSRVAPALPRIQADPRRLDQVLGNLISNAAKFTGEGGKIEVEACRNGSEVKICVRDNGAGISALELDSLFEKYHQTTSGRNSGHKGTGLGLVICKMIVEAHGGRIWAESEEGKGATFTLTIPLARNDLPATTGVSA